MTRADGIVITAYVAAVFAIGALGWAIEVFG
jgi:hypothetical protein